MAGKPVRFRFYGELNDFLLAARRNVAFEYLAGPTDTFKHVIESLGIPHTEIGRVESNGHEPSLGEQLSPGDDIAVFPHNVPVILDNARFIADGHLGRLAAYLRMLGFDTWYDRFADDALLAAVAGAEERFMLTRDVGLLKRREVEQGYCVRAHKPHDQLRELSQRFALRAHFHPFTRCMDCNGRLVPVLKEEVEELLPPHTRATKNEFSQCTACKKIFWRGSHHARMLGWIEDLGATP